MNQKYEKEHWMQFVQKKVLLFIVRRNIMLTKRTNIYKHEGRHMYTQHNIACNYQI